MYKPQNFVELGYNQLKTKGELDYLYLLAKKLLKRYKYVKKPVYGVKAEIINKALKQFFIQRVLHLNFNKKILIAIANKKRLNIGLPIIWLKWLNKKEGFKCVNLLNILKWKFKVFYWLGVGVFFSLHYFFILLKKLRFNDTSSQYVYFDNLSQLNFPKKFSNSKTIINWYIKNELDESTNEIIHNVEEIKPFIQKNIHIKPNQIPFKLKVDLNLIFSYMRTILMTTLKATFNAIVGNPVQALLLKEYPLLFLSKKTKANNFAKTYFFHNSTLIHRPLWTYVAEKKNSNIILYFYSANIQTIKLDNREHPFFGHKEFMSWSNYYVWNSSQEKYIRSLVSDSQTKIVGPIWFQSTNKPVSKVIKTNKKIISIFDVQPYSIERYRILGLPNEYYTLKNIMDFHKDIVDTFSNEKEFLIVLKRKRNTPMIDKEYLKKIKNLYSGEFFIEIDPSIDATSLLEISFASVHFPTTSTAIVAEDLGISSVYYDANSLVDIDDKGLSGIKLIQGKKNLYKWKNSLKKQFTN